MVSPETELAEAENMTPTELEECLKSRAVKRARRLYRLREGYCVRELCGESLVIPVGPAALRENQTAILSPVGAYLWNRISMGQTFGDLLMALLNDYDVGREEAAGDIADFLSALEEHKYLAKAEDDER